MSNGVTVSGVPAPSINMSPKYHAFIQIFFNLIPCLFKTMTERNNSSQPILLKISIPLIP